MPPSAAPEWLRTGWIFESRATSAPASNASIAERMPAQPAPTMRTSCLASTTEEASESPSEQGAIDAWRVTSCGLNVDESSVRGGEEAVPAAAGEAGDRESERR